MKKFKAYVDIFVNRAWRAFIIGAFGLCIWETWKRGDELEKDWEP